VKENAPATIYDVARKAGVSTATVSRLINDASSVREVTRERVLNAIDELNYIPKRGARPGTKDRLPAEIARPPVAFLMVGDFNDPGHSSITTRLKEELRKAADRYRLPFEELDIPELDPSASVRDFVGAKTKGVFLRTSNIHDVSESSVRWLGGLPAVQVLGENPGNRLWMDHLTPDHPSVGIHAATYLMEKGCRSLVFAASGPLNELNLVRCSSFVHTAHQNGTDVNVIHLAPPGMKDELKKRLSHLPATRVDLVDTRQELVQKIASVGDPNAPGLFVPSDTLLTVILSQLEILMSAPSQPVHAIGCNGETRGFTELEVTPATFDLQLDVLAEQAVHRLLRRIQDPEKPFLRISVAPKLIQPDSPVR